MFPKKTTSVVSIALPSLMIKTMELTLIGDAPLISHRWSEKAKQQMRDKQGKKAQMKKEAKNPEELFRESLWLHPDGGYGLPSLMFKMAAVNACGHVSGITKTMARGAFHVAGELIKVEGEPRMREDFVRNQTGVADIRYRGEFPEWRATLRVRFNSNVISEEQIANLFNTAGFACGVGDWRPERDGSFGMFHVATAKEVAAMSETASKPRNRIRRVS